MPNAKADVQRVGVFGGAFDPPHLAHVALVEAAIAQLQLQQVHVLPTGEAWHKPRQLSEAAHRVAMTRLAFAHVPAVLVDEREILVGITAQQMTVLTPWPETPAMPAAPEASVPTTETAHP